MTLVKPPLVMSDDGKVSEAEMSRMAGVAVRLGLWLEYIDGRLGSATTDAQRAALKRRRKRALAAYDAVSALLEES